MKLRTLLLTLALLLCVFISATAAPVIDDAAAKRIDEVVEAAIAAHKAPSCCIVIGTADRVLFAKAYGRLTYDPASPAATLDSPYDLASCSKPIGTGTTLALLLEDGKLKLDDPVSKHLPSWNREDRRTVTVRNLATHTSGLNSYTSAARADESKQPSQSNADALIDHIAAMSMKYKTNEGHLYACLNFLTLARVNEEAAKVSQETLLRERIWKPLGMNNTGYYLTDAQKKLCVPTLDTRQGVVHDPLAFYYRDGYHCPGNAGLFSTANDLARFCQMLLSNGRYGQKRLFKQRRVLRPETVDLFFTDLVPADPKYAWGLGWGISGTRRYAVAGSTPLVLSAKPIEARPAHKIATISHTGYTGTAVEVDRCAGTFMIMLTNRVYPNDNTSVGSIRSAIRRIMIDTNPLYTKPVSNIQ